MLFVILITFDFAIYILLKRGLLLLFEAYGLTHYPVHKDLPAFLAFIFYRGKDFFTIVFLYWIFTRYVIKLKQLNELTCQNCEKEKRILELQLINSQAKVSPHFLFNALNSLYGSLLSVSEDLAARLLLIAQITRYSLVETDKHGKMPLDEELNQIKLYIEFNRIKNSNLNTELNLICHFPESGTAQRIIPMSLVNITENMFKYGDMEDQNNPAILEIRIENGWLYFHCFNRKNNRKVQQSHRIGMDNLQKRLQYYYPRHHNLEIIEDDHTYDLNLNIYLAGNNPIKTNKSHELD
ncbi:sensor histidine kinase [Desertivirga xinjiangensis]|uniref:sensor histidine kinase n=1 Tax=Desertivirga xinjiangensis TaxID=539206 RepID=UPI00210BFE29|nr:histidine kinase [Pedobacter xinjiangensis]